MVSGIEGLEFSRQSAAGELLARVFCWGVWSEWN